MFISQSESQRFIAQRGSWEDLVGWLAVIDLGSAIQEDLHDLKVSVFGGKVQRRISAVIDLINFGAANQQQINRCDIFLPNGVVECA